MGREDDQKTLPGSRELFHPSRRPMIRTVGKLLAAIATVIALLLTPAGCTDGDGGHRGIKEGPIAHRELLVRISAVLRARPARAEWDDALAYADLQSARDQLGLPADAHISGPGKKRLLLSFATRPLFRFSTAIVGRPSLGPLGNMLDTGKLDVAVGTSFAFSGPGSSEIWPWDAVVLRTRQPFGGIAGLLRREGYARAEHGLLVADRQPPDIPLLSPEVPFPAVGNAGGGVIVFGGSAQAVRAGLRGAGAELTATAALLAELPGVARLASGPTAGGQSSRCVVTVGLGEDAAPRDGALVVVVDGQAEASRLLFSGETRPAMSDGAETVFGQAVAEGNRVSVPFSSTDRFYPTRLGAEEVAVPYDCPR